jgi:outer membrane receptor for ferrienterochelin and colicin
LRVTWEIPWNLQLSAQWRFIGRTAFDNNSSQPLLQNQEEGFPDPLLTHIPNYSYLDLSAIWSVSPHVEIRLGLSNALDKDPPFVPLEVTGRGGDLNTFPVYDVLGRSIFMALRATL